MDGKIDLTGKWQNLNELIVTNPNDVPSTLSVASGQSIRVKAVGVSMSIGVYFYEGDKPKEDADLNAVDFLPRGESAKINKTALDMWVKGATSLSELLVSGTGA